jgi:5-methylcytosine-specific restriction protein A
MSKESIPKSKRNRPWNRDEIILALDLYFDLNGKNESISNPKIIELSKLLNDLAHNEERLPKFRNTNGVNLKISNFHSIDPDRNGGMPGTSELDRQIFHEFYADRQKLKSVSNTIKSLIFNPTIEAIKPDEIDIDFSVREGSRIQKLHYSIERDRKIVIKKKNAILEKYNKLECEVCKFDFVKTYGVIGYNFIECHHRTPLSLLNIEVTTKLADLALICSNCHRMVHRLPDCSIQTLKGLIDAKIF